MGGAGEPSAEIAFAAVLVEWRGPAPFVFAPVPPEHVGELHFAAREASYGWGCIPVSAAIGATRFTTSLFPRGDSYYLPIKKAVQQAENVQPGSFVSVTLRVQPRR